MLYSPFALDEASNSAVNYKLLLSIEFRRVYSSAYVIMLRCLVIRIRQNGIVNALYFGQKFA